MDDKSKKLTVFVRVKVENEQDILIGLDGEQPEKLLERIVNNVAYALANDKEFSLLRVPNCERTQLTLFKRERHFFNQTIYLNPKKVVMAFLDADDVPEVSEDEKLDIEAELVARFVDKEN